MCALPDNVTQIINQRPCYELIDVLDSGYEPSVSPNSTTNALGLSPSSDTFKIIFVYPAAVFAVLMAISILACELRRRNRRDFNAWEAARSREIRRQLDDPELPSYAEHWRTGTQLGVDVESGIQPPKYPEAVHDARDTRAAVGAPLTPPPIYR
jgi:hypothetical protein